MVQILFESNYPIQKVTGMSFFKVITFIGLIFIGATASFSQTDVFGNPIPTKKKTIRPIPANYNKTDHLGRKQGPWEIV